MKRFVKQSGERIMRRLARTSLTARMLASDDRNGSTQSGASSAEPILNCQARKNIDEISAVDKGVQIFLSLKYKELLYNHLPLLSFAEI